MGSSLGNFKREEALGFLRSLASALKHDDLLLISLDGCQDGEKIYRAFNDRAGVTSRFYQNALNHANAVLSYEAFHQGVWELITEYDEKNHCHRASFAPKEDVVINAEVIACGERVLLEEANTFTVAEAAQLWAHAGLVCTASFVNTSSDYCEYDRCNPIVKAFSSRGGLLRLLRMHVVGGFHVDDNTRNWIQLTYYQASTCCPDRAKKTPRQQATARSELCRQVGRLSEVRMCYSDSEVGCEWRLECCLMLIIHVREIEHRHCTLLDSCRPACPL